MLPRRLLAVPVLTAVVGVYTTATTSEVVSAFWAVTGSGTESVSATSTFTVH